jgi:hypothetical protein
MKPGRPASSASIQTKLSTVCIKPLDTSTGKAVHNSPQGFRAILRVRRPERNHRICIQYDDHEAKSSLATSEHRQPDTCIWSVVFFRLVESEDIPSPCDVLGGLISRGSRKVESSRSLPPVSLHLRKVKNSTSALTCSFCRLGGKVTKVAGASQLDRVYSR